MELMECLDERGQVEGEVQRFWVAPSCCDVGPCCAFPRFPCCKTSCGELHYSSEPPQIGSDRVWSWLASKIRAPFTTFTLIET